MVSNEGHFLFRAARRIYFELMFFFVYGQQPQALIILNNNQRLSPKFYESKCVSTEARRKIDAFGSICCALWNANALLPSDE